MDLRIQHDPVMRIDSLKYADICEILRTILNHWGTVWVHSFSSHNIAGYLQVLYKSKWPFSSFSCAQFWHEKGDAKGILKLQKHKTWNKLYILTVHVLSMFSAQFFFYMSRLFFTALGKFQAISWPGLIKLKSPGFPGSAGNPVQWNLWQWVCFIHQIFLININ